MPITGPSSYLPTTMAFSEHWTLVNVALGSGGDLVLEGGTALADFQTLRAVLVDRRDAVETAALNATLAGAEVAIQKEALLAQLNLFNHAVRGQMGSSAYARALPPVPGIGEGETPFRTPLVQAAKLWARINAAPPAGFTAPLVLVDGTAQPAFATAVTALGLAYNSVAATGQDVTTALEQRNDVQDGLYALMKAYRQAVPGRFLPAAALVESLPALSEDSTRTPDPVELSGAWNVPGAAAHLTAGVSSDPDLKEYELRWCAGGSYSQDLEHVAGSIAAGNLPVFVTTKGLTVSGAVASFRVYVRLTGGGEAGSETVVVTRP